MATASHFSLTEGIIAAPGEIQSLEVAPTALGVEVRVWLRADRSQALSARRRTLAGPTGCGLCGVDSLAEAMRAPSVVGEGLSLRSADVHRALASLPDAQALGGRTHAVHAAAWWTPDGGLVAVREDVGRHNALDKLAGALARAGVGPASGVLLLTSRVSVEMVQKAAMFGAQALVAVSAPTALAVRTATAAGLTLIAVARDDSFEVFTRPDRVVG
ncbi:MAG: formate dehydrogenase accessory sulfurtransferase FdhD [Phenylobacterium sp.]